MTAFGIPVIIGFGILTVPVSLIKSDKIRKQILLLLTVFALAITGWQNILSILMATSIAWLNGRHTEGKRLVLFTGLLLQVVLLISLKYEMPHSQAFCIGISYYSLILCGYQIERFYGSLPAQPFEEVFLYAAYIPRLLQGPIESVNSWFTQQSHIFKTENLTAGIKLIVNGLFRKLVIANALSVYVHETDFPQKHTSGLSLLLYLYIYAFYLYFDFSGYSNIATGAARLGGHILPFNFNRPFSAASVTEFWRRWHISLMTWLNIYIFQPLSYSLRSKGTDGVAFAILFTFLLSGLWHSVSITFLIWGLLHGLAVIAEFLVLPKRKPISKAAGMMYTFHLFCIFNIFFFSHSIKEASALTFQLFSFSHFLPVKGSELLYVIGGGEWEMIFNALLIGMLLLPVLLIEFGIVKSIHQRARNIDIVLQLLLILFLGHFKEGCHFIYQAF